MTPMHAATAAIGVTGHSYGALTSLRAGILDPRVKAIVPQAPTNAVEALFDLGGTAAVIKTPSLIEGAGKDQTLPFCDNADEAYTQTSQPRALVELMNAGHFTFSDLCQFHLGTVVDQLGFINVPASSTTAAGRRRRSRRWRSQSSTTTRSDSSTGSSGGAQAPCRSTSPRLRATRSRRTARPAARRTRPAAQAPPAAPPIRRQRRPGAASRSIRRTRRRDSPPVPKDNRARPHDTSARRSNSPPTSEELPEIHRAIDGGQDGARMMEEAASGRQRPAARPSRRMTDWS